MSAVTGIYLFRLLLNIVFFVLRYIFTLTNSAYPDEMPHDGISQVYKSKNMYRKYISQLKCSRLSFFEIFLVPNEFTGCNLRVGIRRVHEEFALWKGRADSPPIFGPFVEMVLEHFTGLK